MRAIILAAGEGLSLDGFNKALIRHPHTRERVLDQYLRLLQGIDVTVVVGYRAIEILHRYPQLHYVYNTNWRLTGNAYSLGLALDERPCLVLSADFFLDAQVIERVLSAPPNAVLAAQRPHRTASALNLEVGAEDVITSAYQGALRSDRDPEAPGIFKVSSPALLRAWRKECLEHSNKFALQCLSLAGQGEERVFAVDLGALPLHEINTPLDYLKLMEDDR